MSPPPTDAAYCTMVANGELVELRTHAEEHARLVLDDLFDAWLTRPEPPDLPAAR